MPNQQNQMILDWLNYFIIIDLVGKWGIFGLRALFQSEKKPKPWNNLIFKQMRKIKETSVLEQQVNHLKKLSQL